MVSFAFEASSISSRYPEMDLGNLQHLVGSEMMIHKNIEEPHDLQDAANIAVDVAEYSRCITFSLPAYERTETEAPPKIMEFQPGTTDQCEAQGCADWEKPRRRRREGLELLAGIGLVVVLLGVFIVVFTLFYKI